MATIHYHNEYHSLLTRRGVLAAAMWYSLLRSSYQPALLLTSIAYYLHGSTDMLAHCPSLHRPPTVHYLLDHALCMASLATPL